MFEMILHRVVDILGAGDSVLTTKGPFICLLLAIAGGTAMAQFLKFPLSQVVHNDAAFSWYVRAIAIVSTLALAMLLSSAISWPLGLVAGLVQLGVYHISLAIIRRWVPWFETKPFVGAVCPPPAAFTAAAVRDIAKPGEESGT